MCREISETRRRRVVFEVAWGATDGRAPLGQSPHDQARIRRHDRTDSKIETFFEEIGHSVACPQIDRRFFEILQEAHHDRRNEARDIRVAINP